MGKKFADEARDAILEDTGRDKWEQRLKTSEKLLNITKQYFPQYVEEMQGYAAGAGVNFLDLWTISMEGDADIELRNQVKCTSVVTNQGKLLAHNEDHNTCGLQNTLCIVKKILKDITTLELFYYNTVGGTSVGINSHGFAQALNTLFDTKSQIGVPKNIIGRYLLETSDPQKDMEYVLTLPRASGYNHTIINKSGKVFAMELTIGPTEVFYPQTPYFHTNHLLTKPIPDYHGTICRLEVLKSIAKENMSVEEMKSLMSNTSKGADNSIMNERTVGSMIVDFEQNAALIRLLREDDKGWVTYPLNFI